MEDRYVNPFVVGAKHVFKTMFDIDLSDKAPFPKKGTGTTADVTGITGFTGDRRGNMSFNMTASGALAIYKKLMHEDFSEITPEIVDAIRELTTNISSQATKELEKENLHLTSHVPLVFVGKNVQINLVTRGTVFTIPFCFTVNGKTEEMNLDCVFE